MGLGHERPHVVMFAGPLVSHAVPCVLLARKLCAAGVNISFINTEGLISKLKVTGKLGEEKESFRVVSVPNGEGYNFNEDYMLLLETSELRTKTAMEDSLKRLMNPSQDWAPPCCAIVDTFTPWISKITEPLHIKSYFMWTNIATAAAMMLQAPVLEAQGIIPVLDHAQPENLKPVELPCIPPLHPLEFLESFYRREIKLKLLIETSRCILQEASGLLVNSLYELESSVFDALNEFYQVGAPSSKLQSIIPVGPLLPPSIFTNEAPAKKHPLLDWLEKQPHSSVLYVSFGTLAALSAAQLVEIGLGLEASGHRFIWVVRPPPGDGEAAFHLDTLLPGFSERIDDRGVVATSWAPQVEILHHPATGGFLTHCGWNSIVESLSGSVPMLTWPMIAEQAMNSRWLVDEAKVALKIRNGFETFGSRDQVEHAVRLLMGKPEVSHALRKNAGRYNEILRKGVTESGSSFRNITAFAAKLTAASE